MPLSIRRALAGLRLLFYLGIIIYFASVCQYLIFKPLVVEVMLYNLVRSDYLAIAYYKVNLSVSLLPYGLDKSQALDILGHFLLVEFEIVFHALAPNFISK